MSAGGRRAADLLQLATVAAASLAGGLLAVLALWIRGSVQPGILLFVVAAVMLIAVLTVGTLQTSPGRTTTATPQPPRPTDDSVFGLDPAPPPDQAWYDDIDEVAAPAPAYPAPLRFPQAAAPPPPPDIRPPAYETFVVPGTPKTSGPPVRRIVQCPGCGDFEVEVHQEGDHLIFTCLRRGHRWPWARGRPWPATVVRPAEAPVSDTGTA